MVSNDKIQQLSPATVTILRKLVSGIEVTDEERGIVHNELGWEWTQADYALLATQIYEGNKEEISLQFIKEFVESQKKLFTALREVADMLIASVEGHGKYPNLESSKLIIKSLENLYLYQCNVMNGQTNQLEKNYKTLKAGNKQLTNTMMHMINQPATVKPDGSISTPMTADEIKAKIAKSENKPGLEDVSIKEEFDTMKKVAQKVLRDYVSETKNVVDKAKDVTNRARKSIATKVPKAKRTSKKIK